MRKDNVDLSNMDDDKLIESFFAENHVELEDHGFSEQVMRHLPDSDVLLLQRLWLLVCIVVGIVLLIATLSWNSLQDSLFAFKVNFMLSVSKSLCHFFEVFGHAQNLLMMFLGCIILLLVWGYNKVLDARY